MTSRTEGVAKGSSVLRWVAGGGVLAMAVLLVGLALAGGTAHAADDGVYTGTASVVEEGQCGGGTFTFIVSGNTITSIIVDGSFAGGVPLNDFELLPDITLTITDDVVSETFEPLPGVPTTIEATFSGDTVTGTISVLVLACVGVGFTATLVSDDGTTSTPRPTPPPFPTPGPTTVFPTPGPLSGIAAPVSGTGPGPGGSRPWVAAAVAGAGAAAVAAGAAGAAARLASERREEESAKE